MRGSIPPLLNMPSWRGAQLKKNRGNFTLYLSNIKSGAGTRLVQIGQTHPYEVWYPCTLISKGTRVEAPGSETDK